MAENAIVSAPPALLDTCLKIVKTLHGVQQRMKPAPLTMTSLANECLGLHEMLAYGQDRIGTAQNDQPHLVNIMEAFLLGCSMTVSVVDEYAMELHEAMNLMTKKDAHASLTAEVRLLWKEDDMKELLSQTRGYQNRLKSLLDTFDKLDSPRQTNEYTLVNDLALINLLNGSHSSFQTRPTSIRSSLRDSVISLDPAPPYALSLNGDAIDGFRRIAEEISTYLSEIEPVTGIGRSQSSLSGQNVPEETVASIENDGLHESDEPSIVKTHKSSPSSALAVAKEESEEVDMYGPVLADSSQAHILKLPRFRTWNPSLDDSSAVRATMSSEAKTGAILTPFQPLTEPQGIAPQIPELDSMFTYRVAIVGSEDSGKTEVTDWFLGRIHNREVEQKDANHGHWTFDGARIFVDVLDNTGKEQYFSMRYNYLGKAQACVFIYNSSSRHSFEEIQRVQVLVDGKRANLDQAFSHRLTESVYPTALVAYSIGPEEEREVAYHEGRDLATGAGYNFVEVLSKDDYSPFNDAVRHVVRLAHRKYLLSLPDPEVVGRKESMATLEKDERSLARKMLEDVWSKKKRMSRIVAPSTPTSLQ